MQGKGFFIRLQAVAVMLCLSVVLAFSQASPAFAKSKYATLVIDADTGVVLHQEYAGEKRYPASLTKMMTLYLTFQALESGRLRLNQKLRASAHAASQPPSRLGLRRGERISVRTAIVSLVVKSPNDAAVVLGEAIGGSEWQFAMMMNRMAKRLGMQHTNFRNASGLYHSQQYTTAYDMARLAVALHRDYPQYWHFFRRTKFFFHGRTYYTHNRVTVKYRGAEGLKTGYVRASGFNLVTSAVRHGDRLIGVVMGGRTSKSRDHHMMVLLNRAYAKLSKGGYSGRSHLQTSATPMPQPKPGTALANAMSNSKKQLHKEITRVAYRKGGRVIGEGDYDELPVPVRRPEVYAEITPTSAHFRESGGDADFSVSNFPTPRLKPAF